MTVVRVRSLMMMSHIITRDGNEVWWFAILYGMELCRKEEGACRVSMVFLIKTK